MIRRAVERVEAKFSEKDHAAKSAVRVTDPPRSSYAVEFPHFYWNGDLKALISLSS